MAKRPAVARHATVIVFLAILCCPALQPKAGAAGPPVKVEVGVDEKYDDLAIYLIDQAANKTYTDWDWITEPYLTVSYAVPGRLPTKLLFDFTADIYAKYPIQDYETFRFLIRQAIDDKTAVAVKYTFIPYIFFGDDVQVSSGSSVPTREQSHQIHVVQMTVDREVMSNLMLSVLAKYGIRNAQPAFNYRDFTLWGGSIEAAYRPMPETKLILGSSYERDNARGGPNAFTASAFDDATYDQTSFYATLSHSISDGWLFKGRYAHRWRDYTTDRSGDTLHYGRTDHTNDLSVETVYKITSPLYLHAGYESVWRDSTKSYARYHENIYTIGIDYRF